MSSRSYDTIKLAFPPWSFVMSVLPTLQQLLLGWTHLNNCARAHPYQNHTHGHLYLAIPPQLYALEIADAYPV